MAEGESVADAVAEGESVAVGVLESESDGEGESVGVGDSDADGEVLGGGVLATEADPVPPVIFGSGTTGGGRFTSLLRSSDCEPRLGATSLLRATCGATRSGSGLVCCAVARAAASACSGVTFAGSTVSSVIRNDSVELSVPAVTAPRIWVFTAVARTPAASTPVMDKAVTTRTDFIALTHLTYIDPLILVLGSRATRLHRCVAFAYVHTQGDKPPRHRTATQHLLNIQR